MIKLQSSLYRVAKIKAKTRAEMFKDVKEGDMLRFNMEVSHTGSASGGGTYASYVDVENVTRGTRTIKSQSELTNVLRRVFELEETE